ncbi:MAG: TolC family protein [Kiritimatiellae bacterium]|nr:TolC family protein [Kiritimatiellia bacterium]MDD5521144.1 TolC family protein [Kiritimatiellia bacterium]
MNKISSIIYGANAIITVVVERVRSPETSHHANGAFPKIVPEKVIMKNQWLNKFYLLISILCLALFLQAGCKTPAGYRSIADKTATDVIHKKQKEALGCTEEFSIDRPGDILRRRLLAEQNLPYSSSASLGTDKLQPVKYWPEKAYPAPGTSKDANILVESAKAVKLSLINALQVGAYNNAEYQSQKEAVFQAALGLDLKRQAFRNIFSTQAKSMFNADTTGDSTVKNIDTSGTAGVTRSLKNGIDLSGALAVDLAKLLTQGGSSTLGLSADATVSIPLLRGAGKHIASEPLTQAERNVVYQIWHFERFKRTFAVNIAREYFTVLRQMDSVANAQDNYRSAIASARWSRRRADAGRIREIEVDQAMQRQLSARNSWISAQAQLKDRLDSFKITIGLPTDAQIELDRNDLEQLRGRATKILEQIRSTPKSEKSTKPQNADSPIELVPASYEDAGPLEMDESVAIKLALEHRLDLYVAIGGVYDAQRNVVVKADALRAELTLGGSTKLADDDKDDSLNAKGGKHTALLSLDLPIERTQERNEYRNSLIELEQSTRTVQNLEDQIKLSIRNELRSLLESRESLKIQAESVVVAEKRVRSSTLFLEAGRIEIRDLLDAQDALLSAQNLLTQAVVNYRLAELELQRDIDVLKVNEQGLWQEFSPEEIDYVKHKE